MDDDTGSSRGGRDFCPQKSMSCGLGDPIVSFPWKPPPDMDGSERPSLPAASGPCHRPHPRRFRGGIPPPQAPRPWRNLGTRDAHVARPRRPRRGTRPEKPPRLLRPPQLETPHYLTTSAILDSASLHLVRLTSIVEVVRGDIIELFANKNMTQNHSLHDIRPLATTIAAIGSYIAISYSLKLPRARELFATMEPENLPNTFATMVLYNSTAYLCIVLFVCMVTFFSIWKEFKFSRKIYPFGILLIFVLASQALAACIAPLARIIKVMAS